MRFSWKRAESELEREIAHHLHHLAEEFVRQGHSREEALRLARREFGGSEQVKEQCRDERRWAWTTGLRQDIQFGFRMLRRTPVVTAAAIISLALGIGANTAFVSLMDVVLWRDLPVPNPTQLMLVHWTSRGFPKEIAHAASGSMMKDGSQNVADFFSWPGFTALRKAVEDRAIIAAHTNPDQVSTSFAGRPLVAQQRAVSGNFFSTLQVRPRLGRTFSDEDDAPSAPATVVVSHRFWVNSLGGADDVVGRTMTINNTVHVIAGVLMSDFYGLLPGDATDIYVPLHHTAWFQPSQGKIRLGDNRFWGVQLIARCRPGVNLAQLRSIMDAAFRASWDVQPRDMAAAPTIRLDEGQRGLGFLRREFQNPLLVLGGLVGLLLAIACTNIANLLIARATARQKEVATRVSLGCSQARLMRQFLTESTLLAALGGLASVVVAWLTANVLGQYLANRGRVPVEVALDFRMLAITGLTTVIALLLFGLFPAWRSARGSHAARSKEGHGSMGEATLHRWSAGRILVSTQTAMSVVLVLAAVLFVRNLTSIESADPGFDRRNLIMFGVRPGTSGYNKAQLPNFYRNMEQRLAETPGVAAVGLAGIRPMNIGGWWETARLAGAQEVHNVSLNGVSPSYLPLYTSRLIAGRNLSYADISTKAKVTVISEDLATKLGGPSVLGRLLTFTGRPDGEKPPQYEIVGIAPAFAATSMKERPYVMWLPFDSDGLEATVVLRTTQAPQAVLPSVRETMRAIDANLPMVDVIAMEEQIAKGLLRERMFATLCGGFGILALVLSVVGLYGVVTYSTSKRRSEIGLRLALGAMRHDVIRMVLREGLALPVLGILAAAPVVWLGAKYVEKELFQLKPLDPLSLALALSILITAAVAAVLIPAIRASNLQPVETLRQE